MIRQRPTCCALILVYCVLLLNMQESLEPQDKEMYGAVAAGTGVV